jgi:glycosyltransferase involved in cell wall biosynthesis
MKISVVTVVFNNRDTVESAIRSVLGQRHPDVEYIVVDGLSTDGTMDIVSHYRNSLAQCVSEKDKGIYDAMNKGIGLATGDVIGFLNSDDAYVDPGVLGRVAHAMQSGGLDALFGDVEFFRPENPSKAVRRYRSGNFHHGKIAWGWMPAHPALFVRRQVFERFGEFRTDFRIAGDFEFIARAFHGGRLSYAHLPEVLVRMRTGGVSTGGWRNTLLLNQEVLRACRENGIPTNIFRILSKYPAKLLEFLPGKH